MTIKITNLQDLDETLVREEHALLAEMVQEENPTLDVKRGPFSDLVLYFSAIMAVKNQTEQDRLRRSMSLAEIRNDPTLADDTVVDNLASNFRISRLPGSYARGLIAIVIDAPVSIVIPLTAVFQAQGHQFVTEHAFVSRENAVLVSSSDDRVLTALNDGTFVFLIDVVATMEGSSQRLTKDTLILPTVAPAHYVKSYVASDFTGGSDTESNATLSQRLVYGIAAKAFSGRDSMGAALRNQDAYVHVLADSIIGMGDAEMLRDQHSIFPGSLGGRVDWYVRVQERASLTTVVKEATLVEKTPDGYGIWQFSLDRDEAAGLYDIYQIAPSGAGIYTGSFEISEEQRSLDMTTLNRDGFLPDIQNILEGAYSRFQAVVVRFTDTLTETRILTAGSSTADYSVTLRGLPLIADIQEYALGRRVRNAMGDCLVKAPVPCFLRLTFSIALHPGQETPDTATIANNLAALVNNYGFTGRLPASALSDVIHNSLEGVASASAIDMFGKIRRPDGEWLYLRSTEILEIPYQPENMVTSRTVAFFLDPADVLISVVQANIAPI